MRNTAVEDEQCEKLVALAIAAFYHGLGLIGTNRPHDPTTVIEIAETFRKYMERN